MSLFDIKSPETARAFIHSAAPGLAAVAVLAGVFTGQAAAYIVALVLAISDPLLSRVNTVDGFRKWFYPVMAAASAALIGFGWATEHQVAVVAALVPILLGGGVAAANTLPASGRHAKSE